MKLQAPKPSDMISTMRFDYNFKSNVDAMRRGIDRGITAVLFRFGKVAYNQARDMTRRKTFKKKREKGVTRIEYTGANPPGQPWSLGTGWLRDKIRFEVNKLKDNVSLGFAYQTTVGELHEFGGVPRTKQGKTIKRMTDQGWKTQKYPARPVIRPAMERAIIKFREKWPADFDRYFNKAFVG
jgi:hypothetical protein